MMSLEVSTSTVTRTSLNWGPSHEERKSRIDIVIVASESSSWHQALRWSVITVPQIEGGMGREVEDSARYGRYGDLHIEVKTRFAV